MESLSNLLLRVVLGTLLVSTVASSPAQTFSTLHAFTESTNSDGYEPASSLCQLGDTLYGTTFNGAADGAGSVFKVGVDGNGFANLHRFSALDYQSSTNSDGNSVLAKLALSGDYLYGIASSGGYFGGGTLFRMKTDGSDFTSLYHFVPTSTTNLGARAGIVLSGNTIYGSTSRDFGVGMLFKINLDGTGFTNLYSFPAPFLAPGVPGVQTNADGVYPVGELVLSGDTLYGTAARGGAFGFGTVFKVTTNGTGFAVLHAFNSADGYAPNGLLLSGKMLYGTTAIGGSFYNGTLFAVGTDGNGFTNLHVFTANDNNNTFTNQDGASPNLGLILVGDTLYGTTFHAGPSGTGTVFAMNTNGTGFATVHTFAPGNWNVAVTNTIQPFTNSEGLDPSAGLILSAGALYGTASFGGSGGGGTVFKIAFPPILTSTAFKTQVVLSWPSNYAGFDYTGFSLQWATNLGLTAVWTPLPVAPGIINGSYTTTNPISGAQRFYRLSR